MTARTAVAAALAAATALALCAACTPKTGTVTDRGYSPAWSSPYTECYSIGQALYCYQAYHEWPETWSLKLDDGQHTSWRTVTESEYTACPPGDRYPDCARSQP